MRATIDDALDRHAARPLCDSRAPRSGRHGRGVSGTRRAPEARGRGQGRGRIARPRPGAGPAAGAGGAGPRRTQPREYSCRLRHRHPRRRTLRRLGAARGRYAQGKARCRLHLADPRDRHRGPDRGRPRRRAPEGRRPPRSQAREPVSDRRRPREDPRLRPGQAHLARGSRGRDRDAGDDGRRRDGYRRLHVARAGARGARRSPLGSVRVRRRPLRVALRPARLSARLRRRDDERRSHRRAGPDGRRRCAAGSGARARRPPVPGERPERPVPVRERRGVHARGDRTPPRHTFDGLRSGCGHSDTAEAKPPSADGLGARRCRRVRAARHERPRAPRSVAQHAGCRPDRFHCGASPRQPLRQCGRGILRRRHDRRAHHRPLENRWVPSGDYAHVGNGVQGTAQAASRHRQVARAST